MDLGYGLSLYMQDLWRGFPYPDLMAGIYQIDYE